MKYLIYILLLLFLPFYVGAQINSDAAKPEMVQKIPVRKGAVSSEYGGPGDHMDCFTFRSACDSVFCNVNGIVVSIFFLGDVSTLLIKDECGLFYTFFAFKQLSCVKGQKVNKNDFLGLLEKKEDKFQLYFMVSDNKGHEIDEAAVWKIVKKADSK